MLLDIIITISCGGAGLASGWVMHAFYNAQYPSALDFDIDPDLYEQVASSGEGVRIGLLNTSESVPVVQQTHSAEKVSSVAVRLRSFASLLAANVDAHQSAMEAVTSSLETSDLSNSPPVIVDAVEQLLAANEMMRTQLEESQGRIREQSKQLETAEQKAVTDGLTRIANRRAFDDYLRAKYELGPSTRVTLALLDIDHFKQFNDVHGHRVGDEVLRSVAQMLEARLQPYGMVARFGGEEFAILIDQCELDEAIELIEQTRVAISGREIHFEGKKLGISASIGIGLMQVDETEKEWLQRVDDALYRSKEHGRDCSHLSREDRFVLVGADESLSSGATVSEGDEIQGEPDAASDMAGNSLSADEGSPINSSPLIELKADDEKLAQMTHQFLQRPVSERPKALAYLPNTGAMVEMVQEIIESQDETKNGNCLVAVTLSGKPRGALMRSLLQVVRAAMRSQDRIGCIDQSTLLVCMPDCTEYEARQRAQQICSAATSIGITLASNRHSSHEERLAIGLIAISAVSADDKEATAKALSVDQLHEAVIQAQVVAMLASQSEDDAMQWPISHRTFTVDADASAAAG